MFYSVLKVYARFAIRIYCRKIVINRPEVLKTGGPLLLAANHPNSFLDGIILTTLFDHPVYSLARGDMFKFRTIDQVLRRIQLLPIYRTSEGIENLAHNYTTFDACQKTFEKNGIILIFSEGRSENEWHLRSLKKGTARLAITAWQKKVPLQVIPVGINYSSFKKFGKEIHLLFGEPFSLNILPGEESGGKQLIAFNEILNGQLKQLVYEIGPGDNRRILDIFQNDSKAFSSLFFLPAICGWLLHLPLFYPCKWFTRWHFGHSGHFDSVLHSLLILLYPVYLVICFILVFGINPVMGILLLFIMPFSAWAWVRFNLSRS